MRNTRLERHNRCIWLCIRQDFLTYSIKLKGQARHNNYCYELR